jgi:hypothetical protein
MSPPALVGTSLCVSVMSIVSVDQPKKCSFVGAPSRGSLMSVLKWGGGVTDCLWVGWVALVERLQMTYAQ